MTINWKELTIDMVANDPEIIDKIKDEFERLTAEKTSLLAKKNEILDEQKKTQKQLKGWLELQSEMEVSDPSEAKELILKGRSAPEPGDDQAKALQELRTQRDLDRANHKAQLDQLRAGFEKERIELQGTISDRDNQFKQSVITQKLQSALASEFNRPEDGQYVLSREGYEIDLEESSEDDHRSLSERNLVLYKRGNKSIPFALEDVLTPIKSDPNNQHYLKATFVKGVNYNPSGKGKVDNPWITGNRTQQMLMIQSNPQMAEALQKAAKLRSGGGN
jgi:hypothetical protein